MKWESIFLVIILLIMAGCGNNKQSGDLIIVDVTANYPKKELILQDLFDIEYIPLETNDEFITSANIQAIGKNVIILRNLRSDGDIFIFDRNGKGLKKINRLGQGAEEYTNVLDVTLDENNDEIFINNHYSNKIFTYDLSGNFKRSFKQKDDFFYDQIGNFDQDYLICHDGYYDGYYEPIKKDVKRNFFLIVSKQDGSIKEIQIPYKEKKKLILYEIGADEFAIKDRAIRNRQLIPNIDSWILVEPSADTIYCYSQDHKMTPIIMRTPSIQSMNPEIFLFVGVITNRYYFMQTVKKTYDFISDNGFPHTDIVYDKQEDTISECIIYNGDFTTKKPMSLTYEIPMFTFANKGFAFMKRLEAHELVEAYEKGELKGELKEIAATLDEESNPVIMLAKHKK